MRTSEFDYELPPELIAQQPIEPRDASRLLVLHRRDGLIEHRHFRDIGDYLQGGDLLVGNESRVIAARLYGRKVPTGGKVEFLLVREREGGIWETLVKPGRRVQPGALVAIEPATSSGDLPSVTAEVLERTPEGGRLVRFTPPIGPHLDRLGTVPLPPYIHTPLTNAERYQTIYARIRGSLAAPTAGLHFTPRLVEQLANRGIRFAFVVLHISLDTFRPVSEERIEDHRMHSEWCELGEETANVVNRARQEGRRIVAIGSTSVRVLESAACQAEAQGAEDVVLPFRGSTSLFIYPGYRFRAVDAMITNFHLPRSTLLMLVSAFAGKELVDRAYQEAIQNRYRFYSFGDAMLII
ncbi:MAG: tRNA preQ1(34) S-adenosylmethionine ribosyltransferase-isomerase QueA [Chloroflexi bacterium]|nr:tRNA preQ1(34) S-adenosylmethionine ribosyltransferase-isomerase QueA [Chloroflexota bacterium]